MDKKCIKCGDVKSIEEFGKRSTARSTRKGICRQCEVKRGIKWVKENPVRNYKNSRARKDGVKKWFNEEIKTGPCRDCGGKFPPCCMDYDHLDGGQKKATVATLVGEGYSKEIILAEIAKCDLICANCHRIRTQSRGWNIWDKCKRKDEPACIP